jgi:hypothetical protein
LVYPKTLSPGDGSGFISDNGLNDFFVPRVNADVINTGLFSYFGTANYDFDSRFGVTGTIRRDLLDFLKQIDGVHFGPLQVLEYCR